MIDIPDSQVRKIGEVLVDCHRPLKERFRALFTLKNIGGPLAIATIELAFTDQSALLKHEAAYCLGQMQDAVANEVLIRLLEDPQQEAIVRHEAAEALGAIGSKESQAILEKYKDDNEVAVKETCVIALSRLNHKAKYKANIYGSIDPAPACMSSDVSYLEKVLLDENEDLFMRYRAMFRLRDMNTPECVTVLCKGLTSASSALFKHEIAFVLGQLQKENSVEALIEVLKNKEENEMVRHECAEALGAIATPQCSNILKEFLTDSKRVVAESCEIALDMCEYENTPEFQYADALINLSGL